MSKIPLGDLDRYSDESSVEKFKKKAKTGTKKVKKSKKRVSKDIN